MHLVISSSCCLITRRKRLESGELSLRVTHNDTKLNNVMIDDLTGKGICVIDLDTVMPGLVMNDFGDSIRTGASTAEEDEINLSLVSCSIFLFSGSASGWLYIPTDTLPFHLPYMIPDIRRNTPSPPCSAR